MSRRRLILTPGRAVAIVDEPLAARILSETADSELHSVIVLALSTGLRRGELLALTRGATLISRAAC